MKKIIIAMSVFIPTLFLSGCYVTGSPDNYYYSSYSPGWNNYYAGYGGGGYHHGWYGRGSWGHNGWGHHGGWSHGGGGWGHHGGWGHGGHHR